MSLAILAFCLAATLDALFAGKTTIWDAIPSGVSVCLFFVPDVLLAVRHLGSLGGWTAVVLMLVLARMPFPTIVQQAKRHD